MKITGILTKIELIDQDGATKVLIENTPNLIVATGKSLIASRLLGTTDFVISHMAIGLSNTTPTVSDVQLNSEIARVALTTSSRLANVVTYSATFGPGTGVGTVVEAGLFNGSPAATMLARTTFGIITKDINDTLTINWSVAIN